MTEIAKGTKSNTSELGSAGKLMRIPKSLQPNRGGGNRLDKTSERGVTVKALFFATLSDGIAPPIQEQVVFNLS